MPRTVQVTPGKMSRTAAGFGTVIALLFVVFGVIFFYVVMSEDMSEGVPSDEWGLEILQIAFFIVWIVACLSIAVMNLRVFLGAKNPADASLLQIEEEGDGGKAANADDAFDVRLRKLEALRKDELITEEEYRQKRAQILQENW